MPDARSEIYFFKFDVKKKNDGPAIRATGIQFVTQEFTGTLDTVKFNTLLKAHEDGHMKGLLDCTPGHAILKQLAALPDSVKASDLVQKVAQWRKEARELTR